jgi:hypothetical protein
MKTIEEAAQEYADEICSIGSSIKGVSSKDINIYIQDAVYKGYEFAQRWISVERPIEFKKGEKK